MLDVHASLAKPLPPKPETHSAAFLAEIIRYMVKLLPQDGSREVLGMFLYRASHPKQSLHSVTQPAFCILAQGSKEIFLADERYRYDPAHYLLVTAALPVVGHIVEASSNKPYLSLRLLLEPSLVSSVMLESSQALKQSPKSKPDAKAIHVSSLDNNLQDAVLRLLKLSDSPQDAPFLAPLIMREIIYRLLMSDQRDRLQHIAILGGQKHRIIQAMEKLCQDFAKPLRMDSLAEDLGMSISGFHHHFKAITAMSPLQFQKRPRLHS
ncbi:MAG: AraC family transcriptional regulator [Deinococcales bacterium]